MREQIAKKLLKIQYDHSANIYQYEDILDADKFSVDLIGPALDLLGVCKNEFGQDNWDGFSRDEYYSDFLDSVKSGTDEEIQSYIDDVKERVHYYREWVAKTKG